MITQITNEQEYDAALDRVEDLWNALPGSAEEKELEALIILVEAYEYKFFNCAGQCSNGGTQSSFDFDPFDEDEKTPETPPDVNDLLNQWDKEIDEEGKIKKCSGKCEGKYCRCGDKQPKENWALGKKFYICKKCGNEIYQLEGDGI